MNKKELQTKIDEAKTFTRSDAPQEEKDKKMEEIRSLMNEFKQNKELEDFGKDLGNEEEERNQKKFPEKRSKIGSEDKGKEKNNPVKELRSLVNDYLHSKGTKQSDKLHFTEDRDLIIPNEITRDTLNGVKSTDVAPTIPTAISYIPQDEVKTITDLAQFVNRVAVSTKSGSYPIRKKATAKLNTVAELEENPELAKPNFEQVKYDVETRRGAEPVSQESIDDSDVDLIPFLVNDANEQRINTTNFDIAKVFETFSAKTIKTLDDVKHINNVDLDQAYNRSLVVTGSFYQWLDTLKDTTGHYLLKDDITAASGKSLLTMPVFIIDDDLFGAKGEAHAFIGDLKRAVMYADRAQITARWIDDRIYGQYLQVGTRYDVVKADENAGYFLSLDKKVTTDDSSTPSKA